MDNGRSLRPRTIILRYVRDLLHPPYVPSAYNLRSTALARLVETRRNQMLTRCERDRRQRLRASEIANQPLIDAYIARVNREAEGRIEEATSSVKTDTESPPSDDEVLVVHEDSPPSPPIIDVEEEDEVRRSYKKEAEEDQPLEIEESPPVDEEMDDSTTEGYSSPPSLYEDVSDSSEWENQSLSQRLLQRTPRQNVWEITR